MGKHIKKIDGNSFLPQEELVQRLRADFPEVFSEGEIDPKKLKAILGGNVDLGERYGITWKGKNNVFRIIQKTTTKTLKAARNESINFDDTKNLFIEGDNLEVLKVLQRSYYGEIKVIYIDPPYNTGSDWIYNDNFVQNKSEYQEEAGIRDEKGNLKQLSALQKNTKDSGNYHSDWLNMMYPRLYLVRNLLRDDGVVFVSIDDNEVHNLRLIMTEIFGEDNFVGTITWEKRTKAQNTETARDQFQSKTEYIVVYKKIVEKVKFNLETTGEKEYDKEDTKGKYRSKLVEEMSAIGMRGRPTMIFPIKGILPKEGNQWKVGQETLNLFESRGDLEVIDGKAYLRIRPEDESTNTFSPFWSHFFDKDTYGTAETGKSELSDLLGTNNHEFETVKPTKLIKKLLFHTTKNDENAVILDLFAGSGTTADAIMQLNAEDGGNRKWILIQIEEETPDNSQARKVGFNSIVDIAIERIKLASKKIEEGYMGKKLDIGFKVLKVDETNFKVWDASVSTIQQLEQQMFDSFDAIKQNAKEEDVLLELILKSGLEPTIKREKRDNSYWVIGRGEILIYLEESISENIFHLMISQKPKKIIVLERALQDNDQLKTNLLLQAEKEEIEILVV